MKPSATSTAHVHEPRPQVFVESLTAKSFRKEVQRSSLFRDTNLTSIAAALALLDVEAGVAQERAFGAKVLERARLAGDTSEIKEGEPLQAKQRVKASSALTRGVVVVIFITGAG